MKHWWTWLLAMAVLFGLFAMVPLVTQRRSAAERIRVTILERTTPGTSLEDAREQIKANADWKTWTDKTNPDGTHSIHVWLGNYADFPRTWFGVEASSRWEFDSEGRLMDVLVETVDE